MTRIAIYGCHDTTYVDEEDWGMPFSLEEMEIIGKLADITKNKSTCYCEPTIEIEDK